jgi:hypothetical protein
MCKFCEDKQKIETTIGDNKLIIKLDEEYSDVLNIRIPFSGGGMTRPIVIWYCPFCGKKLQSN